MDAAALLPYLRSSWPWASQLSARTDADSSSSRCPTARLLRRGGRSATTCATRRATTSSATPRAPRCVARRRPPLQPRPPAGPDQPSRTGRCHLRFSPFTPFFAAQHRVSLGTMAAGAALPRHSLTTAPFISCRWDTALLAAFTPPSAGPRSRQLQGGRGAVHFPRDKQSFFFCVVSSFVSAFCIATGKRSAGLLSASA